MNNYLNSQERYNLYKILGLKPLRYLEVFMSSRISSYILLMISLHGSTIINQKQILLYLWSFVYLEDIKKEKKSKDHGRTQILRTKT